MGRYWRALLVVLCAAGFAAWFGAPVAHWWGDALAAFLGRRSQWYDAEDFSVFYGAGTLVAQGKAHLLHTPSAHTALQHAVLETHQDVTLGYYNPAFFALLFVPFSYMGFDRAYQAWTLINVALIALNAWLLWRTADSVGRAWRALIVIGFVTVYPLAFAVRLGQFSLILMASWSAAYLALRSGRGRLVGLALAPLLIKPEMLIPVGLLLMWKRRTDTLRVLVPIAVAAAGVSVAMLGPAAAWDYAHYLRTSAADGTGNMYGWNGVLSATLAPNRPGATAMIALPLAVGTLAAAAAVWRGRFDACGDGFAAQWFVLVAATVLWDLHLYLQDVIILVPAAVAVLAGTRGRSRAAAGAAMAIGWVILSWGSRPSMHWHVNVFGLYLAAVFAALVLAHTRASAAVAVGAVEEEDASLAKAA
jgi:hypothetical protein